MLSSLNPAAGELKIPRHLAIIMDGNGRWAQARGMLRGRGHQQGAKAVTTAVSAAAELGISVLTLFAFSSENWRRPFAEVQALMLLFAKALKQETPKLKAQGIKICLKGDLSRFSSSLQDAMREAESQTARGQKMTLNIAVNYGGRWDIVRAAARAAAAVQEGRLAIADLNEQIFSSYLCIPEDVDLLIRTGGEKRVSNFLLWQCAYSEIYFSDTLWPDFGKDDLLAACAFFSSRERRFGMTSAQIQEDIHGR